MSIKFLKADRLYITTVNFKTAFNSNRHDENVYAVPFECNNGTVKLRLVELNNKADVTIAPSCDQSLEGSEVEENFYHELDDIRVFYMFHLYFLMYIYSCKKNIFFF